MRGLLRGLRMTPSSVTFITFPDELRWFVGSSVRRFVSSSWNAFAIPLEIPWEIPSGTVPVGRSS